MMHHFIMLTVIGLSFALSSIGIAAPLVLTEEIFADDFDKCFKHSECSGGSICDIIGTNKCVPGKLTFTTDTLYGGSFGKDFPNPLDRADSICQDHANNSSLLIGQGRTYKAWIASKLGSPNSRFNKSKTPYYRVDGKKLANDYTNLVTTNSGNDLLEAPRIDQNGNYLPDVDPFDRAIRALSGVEPSGSAINGGSDAFNCNQWKVSGTTFYGDPTRKNSFWTIYNVTVSCAAGGYFYCFEQ